MDAVIPRIPSHGAYSAASQRTLFTPSKSVSRPVSKPSGSGSTEDWMGTTSKTSSREIPEYLKPNIESDATKRARQMEEHMMNDLILTKDKRREIEAKKREEVARVSRRIIVDTLANDWLNKERVSIENRSYLIEYLLPTVVLGVEQLLIEADRKSTLKQEVNANFNPLNYLASYLMRNNPKYSNFSEASPYVRGLRKVLQELSQEMYQYSDNKLAKLKTAAKKKREEKEKEENAKREEKSRRNKSLQLLFDRFLLTNETKADVLTVRSAVKSFTEVVYRLPKLLREKLTVLFEFSIPDNDVGKKFTRKEFVDYLEYYEEQMEPFVFDRFLEHLNRCGRAYCAAVEREQRKNALVQLFVTCDIDQLGLLDRQRILSLFDQFYEKAPMHVKQILRNPHKWPVRDLTGIPAPADEEQLDLNYLPDPDSEWISIENEQTYEAVMSLVDSSINTAIELIKKEDDDANQVNTNNQFESNNANGDVENKTTTEEKPKAIIGDNATEEDNLHLLQKETSDIKLVQDAPLQKDSDANSSEEKKSIKRSVSFVENEQLKREETGFTIKTMQTEMTIESSNYDEENVTTAQFIQITENFLGEAPDRKVMEDLIEFIRDGYQETHEERLQRMRKAHRQALSAKRKWMIGVLFDKWDNDGSGFLELDEVETLMMKYRDGSYAPGIVFAKNLLRPKKITATNKRRPPRYDSRITKQEFQRFIYSVVENMEDDENMEHLIEFLIQSVERSQAEKMRGMARKKWLGQIVSSAYTNGAVMDPVYRAVFQALFKDAEMHGDGKIISANLALLERNGLNPDRGDVLLRYVASTQDAAGFLVGRVLYPDMPNASFQCVATGNPIHIPRINSQSKITFWNSNLSDEAKEGALTLIPLKDRLKRVYGILGVDTLNDTNKRSVFYGHEIQFFQGVAKAFSIAYHHVEIQRKTLRVAESALSWVCRRSPSVKDVTYYMRENDSRPQVKYVLRKMLHLDERGEGTHFPIPPKLERKDNLFRSYLFQTVDTSESISEDAYGERHLAFPLRDHAGACVVVIDIGIGNLRSLPNSDSKEVEKMLKLLQVAYLQILRVILGPSAVGEEENEDDEANQPTMEDVELMFDRLMLQDLRDLVGRMDAQAYAEMRSYKIPPPTVHKIIQSVLTLFYPEKSAEGIFENWEKCKKYVNVELGRKVMRFDPLEDADNVPLEEVLKYLNDIPHHTVDKHGSKPAQYLYSWLYVCISLIEHNRKMKRSQPPEKIPTNEKDSVKVEETSKTISPIKESPDDEDSSDEEEEEKNN